MSTAITDPEVLAFIARTESFYPPDEAGLSVAGRRRVYDTMCAGFRRPHPAGLRAADDAIPGPAGAIPVRRYRPEAPGATTVVYFHGGGFMLGGLDSHDDVCAEIAAGTGCPVVSVDYRLAPEHPHPAAYEDSLAAARAALAAGPVVLAGDSAGACLAASVALTLRGAAIGGQVLIYPTLGGQDLDLASYEENRDAPLLTAADVRASRTLRAGGTPPADDPTFYPLAARDLAGVAPAFISAAAVDPLRDDGVEYARRLTAAGVEARVVVEPQLPHGHLRARHMSARAGGAFGRILDAVRGFAAAPALSAR